MVGGSISVSNAAGSDSGTLEHKEQGVPPGPPTDLSAEVIYDGKKLSAGCRRAEMRKVSKDDFPGKHALGVDGPWLDYGRYEVRYFDKAPENLIPKGAHVKRDCYPLYAGKQFQSSSDKLEHCKYVKCFPDASGDCSMGCQASYDSSMGVQAAKGSAMSLYQCTQNCPQDGTQYCRAKCFSSK